MKRPANLAIGLLCSLAFAAADQPKAGPVTIQGTIQAVQPATGAVDVITGVGMALRLVRIQTSAATEGMRAGPAAGAAPAPLKPGDVVRVVGHRTDGGIVADRIERAVLR